MSMDNSDWQKMTRQGLFRELTYTDEMKKRVLVQINGQQRSAGLWTGRLLPNLLAAAVCIVLVTAVLGIQSDNEIWRSAGKITGSGGAAKLTELPVTYALLDAPALQQGETIFDADRNVLPGLSNKRSPLINHPVNEVMSLNEINLMDKKRVDGFGTLMHYRLNGGEDDSSYDPSISYFGFALDGMSEPDTLYHVGYGHMYEQARHMMTRIFDREALKVEQSRCRIDGEACAWYFVVEDNVPVLYAMFEAKSYERDVDGDGTQEIIVATEKLNQIYIMKEADGQLQWASVREITNASPNDQLAYNEAEGTFLQTASDSGIRSTYTYSSEGDRLVLIDETWAVSPVFTVGDRTMVGHPSKIGILDTVFHAGVEQGVHWYLWGEQEELVRGTFRITASTQGAEPITIVDNYAIAYGSDGADAQVPTLVTLPSPGLWKFEAYVDGEIFGSIVVTVRRDE